LNRVARLDPSRRAELFRETADRMGLSEAVVEKDFWVCWPLKQIFTIEQFNERLLFRVVRLCQKCSEPSSAFPRTSTSQWTTRCWDLWGTAIRGNRDYPRHGN
jgi:hypothetical protein